MTIPSGAGGFSPGTVVVVAGAADAAAVVVAAVALVVVGAVVAGALDDEAGASGVEHPAARIAPAAAVATNIKGSDAAHL